MTKIIFFGTSDYCLPVLKSLRENFNLESVITKPPPNPVFDYAGNENLKVFTPGNVAQLLSVKPELESRSPDLAVVADYGLIIPEVIFTLPKFETVNIHFSHLPDLRGPSPVQYAILSGLMTASVSVIRMAKSVDSGDVLAITDYKDIHPYSETTGTLYVKLFKKISKELPSVINNYISGKINPYPQNHLKATFTGKIQKSDGFLPYGIFESLLQGKPAVPDKENFPKGSLMLEAIRMSGNILEGVERALRAFDPWPGIWTVLLDKKRLKIIEAQIEQEKLVPLKVQLEGKKPVIWKQFLDGHKMYTLGVS